MPGTKTKLRQLRQVEAETDIDAVSLCNALLGFSTRADAVVNSKKQNCKWVIISIIVILKDSSFSLLLLNQHEIYCRNLI